MWDAVGRAVGGADEVGSRCSMRFPGVATKETGESRASALKRVKGAVAARVRVIASMGWTRYHAAFAT